MDPYSFILLAQGIIDSHYKAKKEIVFLKGDQKLIALQSAGRNNKCSYCGSNQNKAYRCIHCGAPMEERQYKVTEKKLFGHSL